MGRHSRLLHPLVLECRHHLQLGNNPSRAVRREAVIAIYLIIYWVPGKRIYITSGTDECKSHPPSWGAKHSAPRHFPLFTRRAIEWLHSSQCRRAFRYHWRDMGVGTSLIFMVVSVTPAQYFSKKRGLANDIVFSGGGLGGTIISLAMNGVIQRVGPAWTFRIFGLVTLATGLPAAWLIKERTPIRSATFIE